MKVLIGVLILLLHLNLFGQKRLKFEILDPMPMDAIAFGYTNSEDNLYAIGGTTFNKPRVSNLQVYDNKINKWLDFPLKDLPRHRYSSAIYVDEYKGIVLAGGIRLRGNSEVLMDQIRIIYPDKMEIESLGTIPQPAKKLGMAHEKNIVYLFGGSLSRGVSVNGPIHNTFSNKFYAYNMNNGIVDELPDLPIAMEATGGIVDGNLYVFGGFSNKPLSSVLQYDIDEMAWRELGELDFPASAYALAQFEKYFILVGDYRDGRQLILYDTEQQKATYFFANVPNRHIGAGVIGDYLHVYGASISGVSHSRIHLSELIDNLN